MRRFIDPNAAALYRDLVVMLLIGVFTAVFGAFLLGVDYISED